MSSMPDDNAGVESGSSPCDLATTSVRGEGGGISKDNVISSDKTNKRKFGGSEKGPKGQVEENVVLLSPPKSNETSGTSGRDHDVVVVQCTRGWEQYMRSGMESSDDVVEVDLTNRSDEQEEVQIVSERPTIKRSRRGTAAPSGNSAGCSVNNPVFRMLQQQIQRDCPQESHEQSKNPTCGVCFEEMGKNTSRQMAAGNCGHVYCKSCLLQAVKTRKKCPTCNLKITSKQVRNIFFEL
jgi:hypothetical protein